MTFCLGTPPAELLCSTGGFTKGKTHLLPGTRGLNIYKCKERLYVWDPLKGGVVDWEGLFFPLSRFTLKIYHSKTNDEKWEMCPTACLDNSSISWLVWPICGAFSDLFCCLCIRSILYQCLVILGLSTDQLSCCLWAWAIRPEKWIFSSFYKFYFKLMTPLHCGYFLPKYLDLEKKLL